MKKKIFIGIGIAIALVVLVIAYFIYSNISERNKLANELNTLVELTEKEDIDMNEINKLLDRTVTKRDYAKLEVAAKRYMKDSLDNIMVMYDALSDDKLINILSAKNYKEDGPDFKDTKKYLKEVKKDLEKAKDNYYKYLTEEKALSYLDTSDLSDYYVDLYLEQVIGDVDKERNDKTVEDSLNDVIKLLEIEENVIDFLIKNKKYWTVEGDNILFDTDKLIQEYNNLIGELNYI